MNLTDNVPMKILISVATIFAIQSFTFAQSEGGVVGTGGKGTKAHRGPASSLMEKTEVTPKDLSGGLSNLSPYKLSDAQKCLSSLQTHKKTNEGIAVIGNVIVLSKGDEVQFIDTNSNTQQTKVATSDQENYNGIIFWKENGKIVFEYDDSLRPSPKGQPIESSSKATISETIKNSIMSIVTHPQYSKSARYINSLKKCQNFARQSDKSLGVKVNLAINSFYSSLEEMENEQNRRFPANIEQSGNGGATR